MKDTIRKAKFVAIMASVMGGLEAAPAGMQHSATIMSSTETKIMSTATATTRGSDASHSSLSITPTAASGAISSVSETAAIKACKV